MMAGWVAALPAARVAADHRRTGEPPRTDARPHATPSIHPMGGRWLCCDDVGDGFPCPQKCV